MRRRRRPPGRDARLAPPIPVELAERAWAQLATRRTAVRDEEPVTADALDDAHLGAADVTRGSAPARSRFGGWVATSRPTRLRRVAPSSSRKRSLKPTRCARARTPEPLCAAIASALR